MTIENSDDTAQVSVNGSAEQPVAERSSGSSEATQDIAARADALSSTVIETARSNAAHDSTPPLSRKLAPPPKPKREPGTASSPPSARPADEVPDMLGFSSALKAPIAAKISYSAL